MEVLMGRTYYVDSRSKGGDGLSPEKAASTYRDLNILPGDKVLFCRGSIFRDALFVPDGEADAPVYFGAYGEGSKPSFLGSVDLSDPACWVEERKHIWRCVKPLSSEVGNLIFSGGESCGILAWEEENLDAQGKWHDTRIGQHEAARENSEYRVFLYSSENPGLYYSHIEAAVYGARRMCAAKKHAVIEDIAFRYSGVHGFTAVDGHDITMRRCDFEFIGGVVWSRELRIRFGNAFELWDDCHDVTMEECRCREIYDSCFTHQGPGEKCRVARNLCVKGNYFENYGMAAYEARDKVTANMLFENNVCIGAGLGFSMQDETPPRKSEIWPQPMGHHLFIWRMPKGSEGGCIEVRNNVFGAAPYGAHVYSIVSPEAEAQFRFENNRHDLSNTLIPAWWGGEKRTKISE
ncbi:MAG: hypothetical protein IIX93_13235 [Clostridia bacterium]|nr:hypothetical protein [Clostridia bacterium]